MADSFQDKIGDLSSKGKEIAGKVASGTKGIASQVAQKVEKEKEKAAREVANDSKRQEDGRRQFSNSAVGTEYMSKTELWSWLKTKSERKKYFTGQASDISPVDFMKMVNARMGENGVPARVSVKKIEWDRSDVNRVVFYINPAVKEANPLTQIVPFEHIGKYTFVEEKTFITPPDLPDVPKKQLPISQDLAKFTLVLLSMGIALFALGILYIALNPAMLLLSVIGIVPAVLGFRGVIKIREIKKHNDLCIKQEALWNEAWTNWEKTIFIHAFQEDINGHLSRIFDSASDCIKQVSQEQFKDAVESVEEVSTANMNELEQLINRRKEEYR